MSTPLTTALVPNREQIFLSAKERAYEALGVSESKIRALPQITPHIRQIQHQLRRAGEAPANLPLPTNHSPKRLANFPTDPYYYLAASETEEARKVLDAYYAIPKCHRSRLPIEAYCFVAGVTTMRILEIITATCVRLGAQASTMISAIAHPRVVEKTVEMALRDEGHEDRADLHKAVGFLPQPKGSTTRINVVQNAQTSATAQAASTTAPPPEQTIRRLVDRFNDGGMRALPEPPLAGVTDVIDSSKDEDE